MQPVAEICSGPGATISRADVAWYILNLAEDPDPGPQRTPIITSAGREKSPAHPAAEDLAEHRTPSTSYIPPAASGS